VKLEDPDFQYMPATVQLGGRLTLRTQPEKRNQLIQSGALRLAADPRQTFIAPKPLDPVPFLNFAPLENALTKLQASSNAFAALDLSQLPPEKAKALDQILMRAERVLTREEGLPRRPWFHHMIYAPGYYTGYGVKTLPGIREALEQRYWMEADQQIGRTAAALGSFAAEVNRAVALTTN
jgi:N-acetylated-alpha-linked acidic dipeptidase